MLKTDDVRTRTTEQLQSVDWSFAADTERDAVHGLHPYPAKFIPQLPRELIRLLHPGDGSAVLDPFVGSGTTLVEAQQAGLPSFGIDLHPLAGLIARVKTRATAAEVAAAAVALVAKARETPARVPDIPRLDHWFKPPVQDVLARLVTQVEGVDDPALREALQVSLSRIIVRVSNQESDTRYAAVDKGVTAEAVYSAFLSAAEAVDAAIPRSATAPAQVITANILEVSDDTIQPGSVGLVVTSPPYPNAYEYWLYHKYRMYWLGMDPIAVKRQEIGARPHYFKKNPQTEHDFERQLTTCFQRLHSWLQPGGLAAFVVGRSIIRGRHIDNAALTERAALAAGFQTAGRANRRIPRGRKSFNPDVSKIDTEQIVVVQRC